MIMQYRWFLEFRRQGELEWERAMFGTYPTEIVALKECRRLNLLHSPILHYRVSWEEVLDDK
jgi:hypothetical protein